MAIPAPQRPLPAEKCTLGCPLLDRCLGGGVPSNSLTELVAESGSGKTQLCLQLALSAQLPTSLGGLSASSLFLHSELPFPSRRLRHLSLSFRHSHPHSAPSDPSDHVFVRAVHSAHHLLDEMPTISAFIAASKPPFPVRVLILDSVAALFRSEFDNSASDLRRRSSLFFKISAALRSLAMRFNLVVLLTNQVVDFIGDNGGLNGLRIGNLRALRSSGRRICPALGLAWANCVNSRLFLSRDEEALGEEEGNGSNVAGEEDGLLRRTRRRLHVLFAPHLPECSTEFVIRREGVFGVD